MCIRDRVAHRLGLIAEVRLGDVRTHVAQNVQNASAGRIDAHVFNRQFTARNDRTGNEEERRGRNIARNRNIDRMEILRRVERDGAAVGLNLNAECAEHALGVVAVSYTHLDVYKRQPQQNAQKYFKLYNKAKTAEEVLTQQIEQGTAELDYLESVLAALSEAENERDLAQLREELTQSGVLSARCV